MPTVQQLRVIVGDFRTGVQSGDVMTIRGTSGIVQAQRELHKNMEFTLQTGEDTEVIRRLPLGSEVNVLRTVPTQDEQDTEDLRRFNTKADKRIADAKAGVKHSLAILNEQYADGVEKNHLYPFNLERAAEVAQYQERLAIWRNIEADAMASGDDRLALLVAVMRAKRQIESNLKYSRHSALSKSTSVISNIVEEMRRDAGMEFLDDVRWMDVDDLWERLGAGRVI